MMLRTSKTHPEVVRIESSSRVPLNEGLIGRSRIQQGLVQKTAKNAP
jgi:hypothetical protein